MIPPPERIGLCPNRLGDNRHYVTNGVILNGDEAPICEACGGPLIVYLRAEPVPGDHLGKAPG